MFTLPSIQNLIVSTIVFIVAAWYIRRYLDEAGVPEGMMRSLSVFMLAYLLSWGSGEVADWVFGTPVAAQTSGDMSQLMKSVGQ